MDSALWDLVTPSLIVFGVTALLVLALVLLVRGLRRGKRAQARAAAVRDRAALALVALDDAIAEADIELALAVLPRHVVNG